MIDELISEVFSIEDDASFTETALEVFRFQAAANPVYRAYIKFLGRDVNRVSRLSDIPFLPVEFFRHHRILSGAYREQLVFLSSGTSTGCRAKHYIVDPLLYEENLLRTFRLFYGAPQQYVILALLPSYLEQGQSSLVYMTNRLMQESGHESGGFFLNNQDELAEILGSPPPPGRRFMLIGVSFALLGLAEKYTLDLGDAIIMETGGMKGRRREITREELHRQLCPRLGITGVHSEYGMTELLSQAYSESGGIFRTPPWMKVLIRDIYDPFAFPLRGMAGTLNIIDLANIYSCSFIETRDMGKDTGRGSFTVTGRLDHSELRGCNLLVTD